MLQFILLSVFVYPEVTGIYAPAFTDVPAVRTSSVARGELLRDIDNHMPRGHHYSAANPITWAHETTHGINANVRNKYIADSKHQIRYNAFYVLNNKAVLVVEPKGTIKSAADKTPKSLRQVRQSLFNLYMTSKAWDNRPLYICDEWSAYTNGSEVRNELQIDNDSEIDNTVYMGVMTLVMLWTLNPENTQLQAFVAWNWERTMRLRAESGNPELGEEILLMLRHSADCAELRQYIRDCFGKVWTDEIFGF